MLLNAVALLSCVLLVSSKPYHGYDQPDYTLAKHQPADNSFEVRVYPAANWTSTSMVGMKMTTSEAFMRLFDYIQGDNVQQTKMPMTVPVSIKFQTPTCAFCNRTYVMSFYLPKAFQQNPPDPNNPMVVKEPRKDITAYVRTFGGYAHEMEYHENAVQLFSDMVRNGITEDMVIRDTYYGATYDSPMHFFARRNEVWILGSK